MTLFRRNAGVKLTVSGPLAYGNCDASENSSTWSIPLLFQPPISVALIACEPVGSATVKLETLDGAELAEPVVPRGEHFSADCGLVARPAPFRHLDSGNIAA